MVLTRQKKKPTYNGEKIVIIGTIAYVITKKDCLLSATITQQPLLSVNIRCAIFKLTLLKGINFKLRSGLIVLLFKSEWNRI